MFRILVIDDEKSIRNTFNIFLTNEGHKIFLAADVFEGLELIDNCELDLVITDIIMPQLTGIDLLKKIREKNPDLPVIVMTGEPAVETAKEAVKKDAHDYLIKPVFKESLINAVNNALEKKKLIDTKKQLEVESKKHQEDLENLIIDRTAALQEAINSTIKTIDKILEYKDPYTAGHERRVGALSLAIAKELNLDVEKQKQIYFAGYLHDIGKLLVPAEILAKPGKLSDGEFGVIKEHVKIGQELTQDIKLPWSISEIILQHHERMDGSGYPNGLKGEDIKFEARILGVSDVIEAMHSNRPYRPGFGIEIALNEIKKNAGKLYDEEVAQIAIDLFEKDQYDFSNEIQSIII